MNLVTRYGKGLSLKVTKTRVLNNLLVLLYEANGMACLDPLTPHSSKESKEVWIPEMRVRHIALGEARRNHDTLQALPLQQHGGGIHIAIWQRQENSEILSQLERRAVGVRQSGTFWEIRQKASLNSSP